MIESDRKVSDYFFQLYFQSQRRLYAFVMAVVPTPAIADSIINDAVSIMWDNFSHYSAGTDFSEWAISYVKEAILSHFNDDIASAKMTGDNKLLLDYLRQERLMPKAEIVADDYVMVPGDIILEYSSQSVNEHTSSHNL